MRRRNEVAGGATTPLPQEGLQQNVPLHCDRRGRADWLCAGRMEARGGRALERGGGGESVVVSLSPCGTARRSSGAREGLGAPSVLLRAEPWTSKSLARSSTRLSLSCVSSHPCLETSAWQRRGPGQRLEFKSTGEKPLPRRPGRPHGKVTDPAPAATATHPALTRTPPNSSSDLSCHEPLFLPPPMPQGKISESCSQHASMVTYF